MAILVPSMVLQQFRTRRNPALNRTLLREIYTNPLHSADVVYREKTRGFPRLFEPDEDDETQVPPAKRQCLNAPSHEARLLSGYQRPATTNPPTRAAEARAAEARAAEEWWCERFPPTSFDEIFGQFHSIKKCQDWLRAEWKSKFMLLSGASGCGKSSIARVLLPTATVIDFITYSPTLFQNAFMGAKSLTQSATKKSSGLIIFDFFTLPESGQKYIRDTLVYYFKHQRGFPIPIVVVLDDITAGFAADLATYFFRVSVSRPAKKVLVSLGYNVLRRAGFVTQRFTGHVEQCAGVASNPRQFTTMLQRCVTGGIKSQMGNRIDCFHSPFDLSRQVWCGHQPRKIGDIARDDDGGLLYHWVAENTIALIGREEPRSFFCDDISLVDTSCRSLFPHSTAIVQHLALLSCRLAVSEKGFNDVSVKDVAVRYPESLRLGKKKDSISANKKEAKKPTPQQKTTPQQNELNKCY